jgi:IS605 OrfB family transposase
VSVKLTLQTQLLPAAEDAKRLRATVERFNEAASWLAGVAFARQVSNKFVLQKLCYGELRERFGLPADTAIRCVAQVVEAYKRDKAKRPTFRKHAAVPFSMGKNIGFKGPDRVSISTLTGRVLAPYVMGKYQAERFGWSKGQCDLVLRRDGKWFLLVTVDVPDGTRTPATDFIGVDLGVENVAVDSDGGFHTGKDVEAKRFAYARRRKAIGKKSKGAGRRQRRRLHKAVKRGERKEARYRRDVNHRIAKTIVAKAKDTGRGIAVEDLAGIRDRVQFRKPQRFRVGGWAFFQLRQFLTYKARLAGVDLAVIDPRNTSRECAACGHIDKANRKSQAGFRCVLCGHEDHADLNAARNLASRARACVNAPQGSERQHAG